MLRFLIKLEFSGYMAPEYALKGVVSIKIDVFSFGVLLLEIVSSKKSYKNYSSECPLNLIGLVSFSRHSQNFLTHICNFNLDSAYATGVISGMGAVE